MRKFQRFFNNIANVRANLRGEATKVAKYSIGDSTNNNRTLTVKQTIRYLDEVGNDELATALDNVSRILENEVLAQRREVGSRRTDAIDIGELVSVYRQEVMNKRRLRREIGNTLRTVNVG